MSTLRPKKSMWLVSYTHAKCEKLSRSNYTKADFEEVIFVDRQDAATFLYGLCIQTIMCVIATVIRTNAM